MKNFAFSILNISSLFILYLSSQSGLYNCMSTGKTAIRNGYLKNKGDLDEVKDYLADELAGKMKEKLIDLLKHEKIFYDLGNMDDEDLSDFKNYFKDMSEYIGLKAADILNSNLEDSLKPFLSKSSFASLKEAMGGSSPFDLKFDDEDGEAKEAKKGNSKDENVNEENANDENANNENANDENSNDKNANDENANDEDVDEATEDFINELVDVYEDKHHKDLEENVQEIKTHNNLD
ncbi:male development gene 1 [Plasmodium cynomolgi strain B]|uniref:Male development gene 1 n=1 Tax=Plasmodium cynomolgi (strain B) TaxID=1120755 RepID=K6UEV3_PLACD|nr:male development gene 1 [Plasmodium cynomolgi strain B]GAB69001.1 male development gene 1 [Plasmodium cynomolgi strain B]